MLPSADTTFNYGVLSVEKAASARAAAERIRGRMQLAAESIIEVGRELIEQKKQLGHGNFLPWIEGEFSMSDETARKYMRVASELGSKFQPSWNLPVSALYQLSSPSTSEPVRTEVMERAANGEKVTAKEIEALKKRLAAAEETIAEKESARRFNDSRAAKAEEQRDKAQTEAAFLRSDHDRLAEELAALQEELERATEPGVINALPINATLPPTVVQTKDAAKSRFNALSAQFLQYWNSAPVEWRNEFLLGRYFPEDLAEALNLAA